MKTLWILSAFIGFTLSEKLDRTYLPPPGSKFSGGNLGEIDVPLEFPKETYPSSTEDNHFGRPEIVIGIDRVGPNIPPEKYGDLASTVPLFHGNSYAFPTTTTSYAFSHTTSYLPAAGSTIGPEISINSKYPLNNSINNPNPGQFGEKYLSFNHTTPNYVYNTGDEKQMLIDDNNILQNQLPDNRINSQIVKKIGDDSVHSYNGDINSIPESNSYSGDLGLLGKIDHSLMKNNYDTYHSHSPSEPINEQNVNRFSSTPMPSDNVYSKTPSTHHQYESTSPISIMSAPYSYRTLPERIRAQNDREAVILNYDNTINPDGYAYSFDTSNGIHADEKATTINGVRAMGSYSYIGDDGQVYKVKYTADENGFRPYGAHLPTAPPIPEAILKVIEQAEIDKANGIHDDGSYDENKYGYQKYNSTKNIPVLNQYNKNREGTKSNMSLSNNQQLHYIRSGENLNTDDNTNIENKQNVPTKNKLQPFMQNEFLNESVSKISPNYEYKYFENVEKDDMEGINNNHNYEIPNKILNSMTHLKDTGNDKTMSIENYDETGYHYSKPQNDFSMNALDKLINRFSEVPAAKKNPAVYKKIVEKIPARPFMTPYVVRNDDILLEHEGGDKSLDIPATRHKDENLIVSKQNAKPFPTLADIKKVSKKTQNEDLHKFINQFKQPDISSSDDQGYIYSKKVNFNNDSYIPFITSTQVNLSDITSTVPTAFPSRFNTIESRRDNILRNPPKQSESSIIQNQAALPNHLLDQERNLGTLTQSSNLDYYSNNDNDDISDSEFRYKEPNVYGTDKDYVTEHSAKTFDGEDFSGPKQEQNYDPLTGYHY